MFNLKTYFVFLSRNKLYTFVNVFGLSISLMFVILIGNYTFSEFTTDNFQENADQIYVLSNENYSGTAYRIGEKLSSRYPEIEKTCGIISALRSESVVIFGDKINADAIAVDSTFFSMFSFKLLQGDKSEVLKTLNDIIISESFAKKVFGNDNPIGNTITVQDSIVYTINSVVEDFKNSILTQSDIIMRVENMKYYNDSDISERFSSVGSTTLFIQTTPGSNINDREKETAKYFKTFFWVYQNGNSEQVLFTPMRELYFKKHGLQNLNKNNEMVLTILLFVGMLILLFAVINYINLTVAQTGFRAKEMATRRLYGASKAKVFGGMIVESSLLCFVAFVIGYLIAFSMEPYASNLIGTDILLAENLSLGGGLLSLLFIIILGAVSGIIPAIIISRFQPIDVVKGTFTFKSKMTFSKVFITIQSVITIILIACSLTIYRQVEYIISYDYGYDHRAIIDIGWTSVNAEALRDRLKTVPSVKSVGFSNGTPFNKGNNSIKEIEAIGKTISFQILISDSATVKMLGIEFLKDNMLSEKGYWVNQTALDELGATDKLKSFKSRGREFKIAGVIKEFAVGNLISSYNKGGKSALLFSIDDDLKKPWNILVEIQGDLVQGRRDVKRAFEEVSGGMEFTGKYIDTQIEESCAEQRRIQKIMVVFSVIAILISSLGLLAISSYFIQQRSREIAVRKIFGSTRVEVLVLVIWRFISLVIVAFVIACPIVWYLMDMWLSDFPRRIDMSVWILLVAGLFNLVIAFFTVYWQSHKVADTNPVKVLMK